MKLTIVYLKAREVEVEAPPGFDAMSPTDKLHWADDQWADDQLADVPAVCCAIKHEDATLVETCEHVAYWGDRELVDITNEDD